MKAIVKTRPAKGFEMQEIPIPAIAPEQVLIKVTTASVCGSDLHLYNWDEWAQEQIKKFPFIVGHEFAGVVEAIGSRVESIEVGDYVSAESHIFCSTCPICQERKFHLCQNTKTIGFERDGCFADYIALPEKVVWKNDPDVHPEIASLQEPLGNAVYCVLVEDVAAKTVVIFGDGPAGLFASEIARVSGAKEVFLVGIEDYRLAIARTLGAKIINARLTDPVNCIRQATAGEGVDVVLEMSGSPAAIEKAIKVAKRGARLCAFGLASENLVNVDWDEIVFSGLTIYGIHGRLIFDTWIKVKNFLRAGVLNLWPIITHRFSLERFEEAFELASSRQCGKIILYP